MPLSAGSGVSSEMPGTGGKTGTRAGGRCGPPGETGWSRAAGGGREVLVAPQQIGGGFCGCALSVGRAGRRKTCAQVADKTVQASDHQPVLAARTLLRLEDPDGLLEFAARGARG